MKYFNLSLMIAFLALYGLSVRSTPGNMADFNILDDATYSLNEFAWQHCSACVLGDIEGDTASGESIPIGDSRWTRVILANTFEPLVLFILALNFAVYIERYGKSKIRPAIGRTWQFIWRLRDLKLPRRKKQSEEVLPSNEMQFTELG